MRTTMEADVAAGIVGDKAAVAHLVVEDRQWKRKSPASRSSAVELDVTEIIGDADRRSARRFCAPSRYDPDREASKPQWDTGQMTAVDEPRIGDTDAVHAAADATAAVNHFSIDNSLCDCHAFRPCRWSASFSGYAPAVAPHLTYTHSGVSMS